jgi:hypothetical protein
LNETQSADKSSGEEEHENTKSEDAHSGASCSHDADNASSAHLTRTDDVQPFPFEVLPAPFAQFVEVVARALPCPPDFVAVPALAVAGAALGGGCELEVKRGWRERPALWIAIIGNPGSKKSPAWAAAVNPLHRKQPELTASYEKEQAAYDSTLAILPWQEGGYPLG